MSELYIIEIVLIALLVVMGFCFYMFIAKRSLSSPKYDYKYTGKRATLVHEINSKLTIGKSYEVLEETQMHHLDDFVFILIRNDESELTWVPVYYFKIV